MRFIKHPIGIREIVEKHPLIVCYIVEDRDVVLFLYNKNNHQFVCMGVNFDGHFMVHSEDSVFKAIKAGDYVYLGFMEQDEDVLQECWDAYNKNRGKV